MASKLKSKRKKRVCICPKCGCNHTRYINWTGRKVLFGKRCKPRMICEDCNTRTGEEEPTKEQEENLPLLMEKFNV